MPTDPTAGFLPPNIHFPEGEGWITFSVAQKSNLNTGTVLKNQAAIIFDVNAPILTEEWQNIIDVTPPVSFVLPLNLTQTIDSFDVIIEGSDVGVGIRSYSIFVSENNGSFELWLENALNDTHIFYGTTGNSYSFYSIAEDLLGNREEKNQ